MLERSLNAKYSDNLVDNLVDKQQTCHATLLQLIQHLASWQTTNKSYDRDLADFHVAFTFLFLIWWRISSLTMSVSPSPTLVRNSKTVEAATALHNGLLTPAVVHHHQLLEVPIANRDVLFSLYTIISFPFHIQINTTMGYTEVDCSDCQTFSRWLHQVKRSLRCYYWIGRFVTAKILSSVHTLSLLDTHHMVRYLCFSHLFDRAEQVKSVSLTSNSLETDEPELIHLPSLSLIWHRPITLFVKLNAQSKSPVNIVRQQ